jgi:hypothetical protein
MDNQKIKVPFAGPDGQITQVDAVAVAIEESTERWNDYKLADGTFLRWKQVAVDIYRIEGRTDAEGNPMYVMKAAPVMQVQSTSTKKN